MKEIANDEVTGAAPPASAEPAPGDALRALVRFAMRQGYYDVWNKPQDKNVRACPSKVFPTDRKRFSG
jgi:hypothetical protein